MKRGERGGKKTKNIISKDKKGELLDQLNDQHTKTELITDLDQMKRDLVDINKIKTQRFIARSKAAQIEKKENP